MRFPVTFALMVAFLLIGRPARILSQDKEKDQAVAATELAKVYAVGAPEFDKAYKGKTLTIEGVVGNSGVKSGHKTFVVIEGYKKPDSSISHDVRCEVSTADFQGIRVGHKVRIHGTVQGHSDTSLAAELRDCKVVNVFADDYPPSKAVREEVKNLQGQWKVIATEANGKKLEGAEAPFMAVRVEGYNVYLNQGDRALLFGLTLDLAKDPKRIDLVGNKATLPSIYILDGDKLQLFLPASLKGGGFLRASGFDTVKNAGILLKTERQK